MREIPCNAIETALSVLGSAGHGQHNLALQGSVEFHRPSLARALGFAGRTTYSPDGAAKLAGGSGKGKR
jgi:hypothetical protein